MEEKNNVTIHISIEPNIVNVPYTTATNAEEICTNICKQLNLLPVSRPLFALRIQNSQGCKVWLPANSKLLHGNKYEFRMRFKVSSLNNLLSLDKNAYDYYFHQTRKDVLENQIPEIVYAKHKSELLGLGVVDMYRDMIEHKIPAEEIEKNYKRYIPKEISKKHSIFTKKPIHISLGILRKQTPDIWFVKNEYLKQVDSLAPNYLAEEYTAMTDLGCGSCLVNIMVAPYHAEQPGVRVCYDNKEWQHLCTIDDLCFISIRTDSTVEISRRNGIPSYLKFNTVHHMLSFVSILDGYYRLSVKWTFNLCKDVPTPSLKALNSMKCHGPVGGEFSYAKLEEKRNNKHGCYIIRECKQDFHTYFIDVCTKSEKPETYKVSIIGNEWIMHSNSSKYESLTHLISSHKDSLESPYLSECLPPSEYDKSPLLLCEPVVTAADSKACISDVEGLLRAPHCINPRDIQYFKRCKVSHLGIEFSDLISVSGAGLRCQRWFSEKPIHPISKDIKDLDFPERSINLANNYCRNPLRRAKGPWCYTMDPMVIDDSCDIPLCRNLLCRVTGPGMDYSGKQIKTVSDRTCKSWKWWMSRIKKLKTVNGTGQAVVFDDWLFPENSRSNANNFCRNPDGDIGGNFTFDRPVH